MFSRQEHHFEDQIVCWNCEETVHQSAIVCPYCNVDIHRHQVQKASEQQKITPLSQQPSCSQDMAPVVESYERNSHTFRFLCSLFILLAGSSLFFLSVMIALFAHDGSFTISWQEHTWSAFFGLGLSLLSLGCFMMQKLPDASEEVI